MNELEGLRNEAYDNARIYQDKTPLFKEQVREIDSPFVVNFASLSLVRMLPNEFHQYLQLLCPEIKQNHTNISFK